MVWTPTARMPDGPHTQPSSLRRSAVHRPLSICEQGQPYRFIFCGHDLAISHTHGSRHNNQTLTSHSKAVGVYGKSRLPVLVIGEHPLVVDVIINN